MYDCCWEPTRHRGRNHLAGVCVVIPAPPGVARCCIGEITRGAAQMAKAKHDSSLWGSAERRFQVRKEDLGNRKVFIVLLSLMEHF